MRKLCKFLVWIGGGGIQFKCNIILKVWSVMKIYIIGGHFVRNAVCLWCIANTSHLPYQLCTHLLDNTHDELHYSLSLSNYYKNYNLLILFFFFVKFECVWKISVPSLLISNCLFFFYTHVTAMHIYVIYSLNIYLKYFKLLQIHQDGIDCNSWNLKLFLYQYKFNSHSRVTNLILKLVHVIDDYICHLSLIKLLLLMGIYKGVIHITITI